MKTIQFLVFDRAWVMPVKTRIDMLAAGVKTPSVSNLAGPGSGDVIEDIDSAWTPVAQQR